MIKTIKAIKVIFSSLVILFSIILFISCTNLYRVYNDEDLNILATSKYGFSEVFFFKVVDSDTAKELTGKTYNNGGVISGIKDGVYRLLFIPKIVSQEPFLVNERYYYNNDEIYQELRNLEDEFGSKIYIDPSNDYGGLSISVAPYIQINEANPDINFNSKVFFIIISDNLTIYVNYVNEKIYLFNSDYDVIN